MLTNRLIAMAAVCAFLLSACAGQPAQAHRVHEVVTTLTWSAGDQRLYVTHVLHEEDAVDALIMRAAEPLGDGDAAMLAAAEQLTADFALRHRDAPIALTTLGGERDGGSVFLYQEAVASAPPDLLQVRAGMLMDLWPQQTNRVVVDFSVYAPMQPERTLVFTAPAGWQSVKTVRTPDREPLTVD